MSATAPPRGADDAAALRRAAALLEAAAQLLSLPDAATLAAAWYLHRTHAAAPGELSYEELVPACLFLASKVEECPRRTGDVLHACRRAAAPPAPGDPAPLPPCFALACSAAPPDAQPPAPLVADAYYCAKDALISAEAAVLRAVRYDVGAPSDGSPHRMLYNLAAACRAPRPVVRVAAALLRDAWLCGAACGAGRGGADVLAAGALRAAGALLKLPLLPPLGAADALGLGGEAAVDAAAAELLTAVSAEAASQLADDERRAPARLGDGAQDTAQRTPHAVA